MITAPIEQFPVNAAPGSIASLPVIMSPFIEAVACNVSNSATVILPFTSPEQLAVWQIISPLTLPVSPITILPDDLIVPVNSPSILMLPLVSMSPVMEVPFATWFL